MCAIGDRWWWKSGKLRSLLEGFDINWTGQQTKEETVFYNIPAMGFSSLSRYNSVPAMLSAGRSNGPLRLCVLSLWPPDLVGMSPKFISSKFEPLTSRIESQILEDPKNWETKLSELKPVLRPRITNIYIFFWLPKYISARTGKGEADHRTISMYMLSLTSPPSSNLSANLFDANIWRMYFPLPAQHASKSHIEVEPDCMQSHTFFQTGSDSGVMSGWTWSRRARVCSVCSKTR